MLVVRPDSYGDLVLSEPLLTRLAEHNGAGQVAVVVRESYLDIAAVFPEAEWIASSVDPYRHGPADPSIADALGRLRAALEEFKPEVIVAPCREKTWLEAVIASWFPEAEAVAAGPFGMTAVDEAALIRAHPQAEPSRFRVLDVFGDQPDWIGNRRLGALLTGTPEGDGLPTLPLPASFPEDESDAIAESRYLACCPGGSANVRLKAWPAERFAAVIADWESATGVPTLLLGHATESPLLERVRDLAEKAGARQVGLWLGKDGEFGKLARKIARASCYLGNDTGAMHLAAACRLPGVAVFGGGTWPRFAPAGGTVRAVVKPLTCYGCGWHCPYTEAPCIRTVSVATVSRTLLALDSDTPPPPVVEESADIPTEVAARLAATAKARASSQHRPPHDRLAAEQLLERFQTSESDRAARLQVIQAQGEEISKLEASVHRLLEERAATQARCDELATRSTTEREQSRSLTEELAALTQSNARLIRSAEAAAEPARREIADLTARLDFAEQDRAARLRVIHTQGEEISKLEASVHRLLEEGATTKARCDELAAEVNNERAQSRSLTAELAALARAKALLSRSSEEAAEAARREIADLGARLDFAERDRAARLHVIHSQGARVSELEANIHGRIEEIAALVRKLDHLSQGVEAARLEVTDLTARLEAAERDRGMQRERLQELGRRLEDCHNLLEQRTRERDAQTAAATELSGVRQNLEERLGRLEQHPLVRLLRWLRVLPK